MGWRVTQRLQRRCYKKLQDRRWEEESAASLSSEDVGYRTSDAEVLELLELLNEFEKYRRDIEAADESTFSKYFTEKKVNPLHLWMDLHFV